MSGWCDKSEMNAMSVRSRVLKARSIKSRVLNARMFYLQGSSSSQPGAGPAGPAGPAAAPTGAEASPTGMQQLEAHMDELGAACDGAALDMAIVELAAAELVNPDPECADLEVELARVIDEDAARTGQLIEDMKINKCIARGDISSQQLERLVAHESEVGVAMDNVANVVVGNSMAEAPCFQPAFHVWADGATTGARIVRERLTALATIAVGFNRRFACSRLYVACCKELGPDKLVVGGQGEVSRQESAPDSKLCVRGVMLRKQKNNTHKGFRA